MSRSINAYASSEFQEKERLRAKARHDEAQALYNARLEEREKWQSVVADKDIENEKLRKQLAELQAKLDD